MGKVREYAAILVVVCLFAGLGVLVYDYSQWADACVKRGGVPSDRGRICFKREGIIQ